MGEEHRGCGSHAFEHSQPHQGCVQPKGANASSPRLQSHASDPVSPGCIRAADLVFLEIFAGSARLSKAVKSKGFQVVPVDKVLNRSQCPRTFSSC